MLQRFFLARREFFLGFWLVISLFSLAFAYFVEFGLGYTPCILCLYQRYPYYLIVVLSIMGISIKRFQTPALVLITLCLITGGSIAFYHTGVERGIFEGTSQCHGATLDAASEDLDALEKQLYSTEASSCLVPPFKVLGLSMTEWNLIYNIILLWIMHLYYKTAKRYVFKDK